ncbi:MAG: hypothetical protein II891_05490 [Bacteroidales bacterium]|nr:hypothetical protein [Bacteroidales bacterium]
MENDYFYDFSNNLPLNTVAVSPDLYERALLLDLRGEETGRKIHRQLMFGDFDTKEYPSYISFPVSFHQFDGRVLRDALDMRAHHPILVSDNLLKILTDNQITGWRSYPVLVYDKKGNEIRGYNGFTVTGRGGEVKFLKDKDRIPYDNRKPFIQWDKSQWDGSDFFWVKPLYLFATKRVQDVFKREKIKYLRLSPLSDYLTIV